MRQRFYIDGKLSKSISGDEAKLQRYLDNIERDWSRNGMFPLTEPGQFDTNNAHAVIRVSVNELHIINTAGKKLRWINV